MANLRLVNLSLPQLNIPSLHISAGECVCIHGPSGSGKTRLMRAIVDLDEHHGEVWCGDICHSACAPPQWRTRVGYLPTESHWWAEHVGDHFRTPETVDLNAVGLPDDAMNWEIDRASSGERQRLAILRVLDIQPEALLLDEPTANLDAKSIRLVERLLESYRKEQQCATLFVSHDPVQRQRVSERSFEIHQGTLRQESTWT